jgi:gluconate 2-dehydrogenase gamma chain
MTASSGAPRRLFEARCLGKKERLTCRPAPRARGTHSSHRPKRNGATLSKLASEDQVKVLKGLESGEIKLDEGVDSKTFFEMLLQNTKEGYFSDPIYGGNKDMAAWKMIGFPGAHYDYKEWVSRHGERVPYPTVGFKGRPGWTETSS